MLILVNQIVEMHSRSNNFFIQDAVMLVIKPIAVENVDISDAFKYDWKPESSKLVFDKSSHVDSQSCIGWYSTQKVAKNG